MAIGGGGGGAGTCRQNALHLPQVLELPCTKHTPVIQINSSPLLSDGHPAPAVGSYVESH